MKDAHTTDVYGNTTELSRLLSSTSSADKSQNMSTSTCDTTESEKVKVNANGGNAAIAADTQAAPVEAISTSESESECDEVVATDTDSEDDVSVVEVVVPSVKPDDGTGNTSSAETLAVSRLFIGELEVADDTVSRTSSVQGEMCRICHCVSEDTETLISPCDCRGSMKWVHQKCLQRWVKSRDARKCELCGFSFNMTSSVKPFRKWKKLNMSSVERRRVLCSVTFHIVAITCVIWSLYVLIDRTTQEIQSGDLNWPFWTKLVVVAIGFTGGLVFMYVQCKTYVKLFRRWKQFNRVIYINDIQLSDGDTGKCPDISLDLPPDQPPTVEVLGSGGLSAYSTAG